MIEGSVRRVAIACQGGGSHTAFTAGVLKKLLREKENHDYEVVALSGTSGGAICALLAWYGLLMDDADRAVELLDSFWRDNSANSYGDRLLNDWLLWINRFFENTGGTPTISPYYYPSRGQDVLRRLLERHVDFQRANELAGRSDVMLIIGAVNVLSGEFKDFNSRRDRITAETILASAAVPTLFRAVRAEGGVYWDGLLSQNPPVRELPEARPDEIWVIQINPETRESEPRSLPDIIDRRNELAGNLSLRQEIYFIETVNKWVEAGALTGTGHTVIDVKWIELLRDLDTASKLNRSPSFVQDLMAYGEEQAGKFLDGQSAAVG